MKDFVDKYPPDIQAILEKPAGERNPYEWQMFYKAKPYLEINDAAAAKALKGGDKQKYEALTTRMQDFAGIYPGEAPLGVGMRDISATAPATRILKGGSWENPTEEVQPGFLTLLDPKPRKSRRSLRSDPRDAALRSPAG